MIFRLLFTKPGLPTREQATDDQLLAAFGVIMRHYPKIDLLGDAFLTEAVSTFGLTLISNRFKKIFVNSKEADAVASVIGFVAPIFRRFCSLQNAARQFQNDGLPVHLIRMVWRLVSASDGLPWASRSASGAGPELIIS